MATSSNAPVIYVYGSDHSPWVQSVLLFLEYKQLKYALNTTPDWKSIVHNKKNGNISIFQQPVLHYNDIIISDSIQINQFIHSKHPFPPINEKQKISQNDKQNLFRIFYHALSRTKSRLFRFFHSWSLLKDDASFISILFRPMIAFYFAFLITFVNSSNKNVQKLAKKFKENVQMEDENAYYPQKTFIFGLRYFEKQLNRLYRHNESDFPSMIDFLLFGQFQCLHTGLSEECIPLINEYFPSSKEWVKSMHQLIMSKNSEYNRLYTANKIELAPYWQRVLYWIGFVIGFPVNASAAMIALATRSKL